MMARGTPILGNLHIGINVGFGNCLELALKLRDLMIFQGYAAMPLGFPWSFCQAMANHPPSRKRHQARYKDFTQHGFVNEAPGKIWTSRVRRSSRKLNLKNDHMPKYESTKRVILVVVPQLVLVEAQYLLVKPPLHC